MKTLVKLILAAGCLAAIAYFSNDREANKLNQLASQNIEALAQGENGGNVYCYYSGSVDCRGYKVEIKISGLSLEQP